MFDDLMVLLLTTLLELLLQLFRTDYSASMKLFAVDFFYVIERVEYDLSYRLGFDDGLALEIHDWLKLAFVV